MSLEAESAAIHGFQCALEHGEITPLIAPAQVLDALKEDLSFTPDLNSMGDELRVEVPYPEALQRGYAPNKSIHQAWVGAVRGILNQIKSWGADGNSHSNEGLRTLVTAAYVLDVQGRGLAHVATAIVTEVVRSGLETLLSEFMFRPFLDDKRHREAHDDARDYAQQSRYEMLLPRFHHLFFGPGGDISAIVTLLHASFPDTLARVIETKNDINLSGVVNYILREKALRFAVDVQNNGFKFACLASFVHEHRQQIPAGWDAPLGEILHQVADNSKKDWESWMRAFLRYPGGYSLIENALALELSSMDESQWLAFLRAPMLSHFGKCAAPFAQMMIDFRAAGGDESLAKMSRLAYQIWNEWNYRDSEHQSHLFSPAACAFDFPVAVYYACQTKEFLDIEENRLQQAINSVEEQWFDSSSALTDERYRLMSRLRLVRHGLALQNGCPDALPPLIEPESHPYFRARHPYSSVNH
ncbi:MULTISPECIES: hypothetical protein [unclassified Herbaspirillum]|uniref:hypothetical protein n=1 Tax=unclassified Herbaspirillum TaxID=2624150 RepID=UPI001150DDF7|nr:MULTISPECIES: hypothetical protein [unclassified Herbaspirillum]MBB5392777.1 hypothetical protein [Herbaspirillum sp. SJZ102]TQK04575.1 hypothetical protein FB599_3139 [Herbaspirillum sp. SJZ130]TQK09639.1 hypothetical protein FB598_2622 [Herbaspirillum sp. SJZ106]